MIPLLQMKTADTAHTEFLQVTPGPFPVFFLGWGLGTRLAKSQAFATVFTQLMSQAPRWLHVKYIPAKHIVVIETIWKLHTLTFMNSGFTESLRILQ